jgi:AraC family transcriptional regulator
MPEVQSRIEVFENGRRASFANTAPLLSASPFLNDDTVIERYATCKPAEYKEREFTADILFLFDSPASRVVAGTEAQRFTGQIRPGHTWLIPRHAPHHSLLPFGHSGVAVAIGRATLERHVGPLLHGGRAELASRFGIRDSQLEHLLLGLLAVAKEGSHADPMIGEFLLNAACRRLVQSYAVSKLNPAPRKGGIAPARLKRVLQYIEDNLDRAITLSDLSSVAGMSLYYFATLFKQSVGLTPHKYILQRRISLAQQLLRNENISILDISLRVGFEYPNNFARVFYRITGVSPSRYRQDFL